MAQLDFSASKTAKSYDEWSQKNLRKSTKAKNEHIFQTIKHLETKMAESRFCAKKSPERQILAVQMVKSTKKQLSPTL